MPPNQINFENLHFNPFYNERFSDAQKMRETQNKIPLMKSTRRNSNVLIFSQMRLKVFFLRKRILKLFNAIHVNIRSLLKNFDNLLDILRDSSKSFNVLCLTETCCTDSTLKSNTNLHLPNFDII